MYVVEVKEHQRDESCNMRFLQQFDFVLMNTGNGLRKVNGNQAPSSALSLQPLH